MEYKIEKTEKICFIIYVDAGVIIKDSLEYFHCLSYLRVRSENAWNFSCS